MIFNKRVWKFLIEVNKRKDTSTWKIDTKITSSFSKQRNFEIMYALCIAKIFIQSCLNFLTWYVLKIRFMPRNKLMCIRHVETWNISSLSELAACVWHMNKGWKFLKKLWCCVGGGNKVIWLYQLSWKCKFATVTCYKADVSSVSPSSERMCVT